MVHIRKGFPVSYSLCDQIVTLYHRNGGGYTRKVIHNAFLDLKKTQSVDKTGSREASSFLLVIPGDVPVRPGDKVIHGDGPSCASREDWAALIPATCPGLCVVQWSDAKRWKGQVCHWEAGG